MTEIFYFLKRLSIDIPVVCITSLLLMHTDCVQQKMLHDNVYITRQERNEICDVVY